MEKGHRYSFNADNFLSPVLVPGKEFMKGGKRMTEPKSECCGATVRFLPFYKRYVTQVGETYTNIASIDFEVECDKCHKPCKVKEEK